jgi:formamidopyrimidine-DNA glycosylase
MPEGVEVRLFTEEINKKFTGSVMKEVKILGGKYSRQVEIKGLSKFRSALPLRIEGVFNKGKFCWIQFEKGWSLWVTFGLTGMFRFECEDHCHVYFDMGKSGHFYYKDMRNFGTLKACQCGAELEKKLGSLGIDPLEDKVTGRYLMERVSAMRSDPEIGKVMIEKQSFVAGIGNYMRAEILYFARISPFRRVKEISSKEWDKIAHECNRIFKDSYKIQKKNGLHTYPFAVYRRRRDDKGRKVVSDKLGAGDRTIWWVPEVQK